jgi:hypothetical protein
MKTPEVLGGALFYAAYIIKKVLVLLAVFGVTFCLLTHRHAFATQVEHMQSTWGT